MTGRAYSVREMSELLQEPRRKLERRAIREAWPYEEQTGRGGSRRIFKPNHLPPEIKDRLSVAEKGERCSVAMQAIEAQLNADQAIAGLDALEEESEREKAAHRARLKRIGDGRRKLATLKRDDPKRLRAEAKSWIVYACAAHRKVLGGSQKATQMDFSIKLASGDIELPASVAEWLPRRGGRINVSEGSLQRWSDTLREEGVWGLVDGYGNNKGQNKVIKNPELYKIVLAAMIKHPQIRAKRLKEFLAAEYPDLNIISERRLQAFLSWWKSEYAQLWMYITNPDQWKNVYMSAIGTAFEHIHELNQLWELDSTPADWMLTDGRHSVVGVIDMYSRRLKFFVSKTSTAAAVGQVTRLAMLEWGLPKAVRTDNGRDYVSDYFTGLMNDLEIKQLVCVPFASEEKGTIERSMRTMSHGLLELLPGFIGHNVSERKAIESRKAFAQRVMTPGETIEVSLTARELQEKLNQWTDHIYAHNPHEGLSRKTPWEVANAWSQPIRRIADEHALDELLAPIGGTRTITKKGLRHDNRLYIDPTGVMYEHVGRDVMVRLEEDLGRLAVYLEREFLCWAEDPEVTGINRREAAAAVKHHQKKVMTAQSAELKKLSREFKQDIVQTVIDHRIAQSENITPLPKRSISVTTPALEEAGKAYRAKQPALPDERDAHTESAVESLAQEMAAEREADVLPVGDPMHEYAHWVRVDQRIQSGGRFTGAAEERWYKHYPKSDQYESTKNFFEEFGLDAEQYGV